MTALIPSWVDSANAADHPFPLNNLPFGVFSPLSGAPSASANSAVRCGVAIGDHVLDLAALEDVGLIERNGFSEPALNGFMARGPDAWDAVRARLMGLLGAGAETPTLRSALHDADAVRMHLPFRVAEYTDFYASRQHATNVGTMFRGAENALPPNWLHIPIGYNGRASTVVVSGTEVRRPSGQLHSPGSDAPTFGPCKRLDIELELGAVVGLPSEMGTPVTLARAEQMIFGYVLLNDWSARDMQAWEYQPLGPFQSKAFATSIGPWVVTAAALEPFRRNTPAREVPLLPYIADTGPMLYDIELEVDLMPDGGATTTISRTNYGHMYYSAPQLMAHHASSGCAMRTGDLLGSGTISGDQRDSCGSMLELTWGGAEPLELPGGHSRSFLEDGDTIRLRGHAQGDGYRVGFGDCVGRTLPARQPWNPS